MFVDIKETFKNMDRYTNKARDGFINQISMCEPTNIHEVSARIISTIYYSTYGVVLWNQDRRMTILNLKCYL